MLDSKKTGTAAGIVALFNASDDTIDMIQKVLTEGNDVQTLVWCHFADLKKGIVNFGKYVAKHNPEVVTFDISPPYDENWHFFTRQHVRSGRAGRLCHRRVAIPARVVAWQASAHACHV
jgi:hypothetical protein